MALTCTKVVQRNAGKDEQGKLITYHTKCGEPASEVEIQGFIGVAKAVLCQKHARMVDDEAFVSTNGYPKGKIDPKAKKDGYQQRRFTE